MAKLVEIGRMRSSTGQEVIIYRRGGQKKGSDLVNFTISARIHPTSGGHFVVLNAAMAVKGSRGKLALTPAGIKALAYDTGTLGWGKLVITNLIEIINKDLAGLDLNSMPRS